jgi:hypothetical protein
MKPNIYYSFRRQKTKDKGNKSNEVKTPVEESEIKIRRLQTVLTIF